MRHGAFARFPERRGGALRRRGALPAAIRSPPRPLGPRRSLGRRRHAARPGVRPLAGAARPARNRPRGRARPGRRRARRRHRRPAERAGGAKRRGTARPGDPGLRRGSRPEDRGDRPRDRGAARPHRGGAGSGDGPGAGAACRRGLLLDRRSPLQPGAAASQAESSGAKLDAELLARLHGLEVRQEERERQDASALRSALERVERLEASRAVAEARRLEGHYAVLARLAALESRLGTVPAAPQP